CLLEHLPRGIAPGTRVPRARVALDALERILRVAAALPLDQLVDVELAQARQEAAALPGQRLAEVAPPPPVMRGPTADPRRPAHPLRVPGLAPQERGGRGGRVEPAPLAPQPGGAGAPAEPRAASALAKQDHPARLDIIQGAGPGWARPRAGRSPPGVPLGA